ncbi:MAG: hypothetical protein P8103_02530 [Candidatus Thiodiazotropha sp.]
MCITIPSSANVRKARQWVVWQWLSASPLRLYLIGGGLMLLAALAQRLVGMEMAAGWAQFNLLFALMPILLLGGAFEWLPPLLKVTPLTYVRFASLFFLLLIAQILFHADGLLGEAPGALYLLPLGLAWVTSLLTLRGMLRISFTGLAPMAAAVLHLLLLAGTAGLLIAVGLVSGWLPSLPAYAWTGVLPLYLFALLVLIYLRIRARTHQPG